MRIPALHRLGLSLVREAKSADVIDPRDVRGRVSLKFLRHASILPLASAKFKNQCVLRHSSRNRPLNDSTNAPSASSGQNCPPQFCQAEYPAGIRACPSHSRVCSVRDSRVPEGGVNFIHTVELSNIISVSKFFRSPSLLAETPFDPPAILVWPQSPARADAMFG
jgi:hypothetical protein